MRPALLATLAGAALAIAACGKPPAAPDPVRPVLVQKVAPGTIAGRDVYSGEVRARYEADLSFRIPGKLVERKVDAGARVKKGQPLARLDPEDARLAADAARAQLAAAESDAALAKAERERYADLLARRFISESAYEAKLNAYNVATARLGQARSQAAISTNQAAYTTLSADSDGIVVSVAAEPGQVLAAGQPVLRLARAGEREVVVNAPESEVARFRPGQAVAISLWADRGRAYPGRVREIAGGADPATRTYAIRVTALELPEGAQLGMTASVAIAEAPTQGVLLPLSAILEDAQGAAVWVVDPRSSQVKRRKVAIGEFREDGVTVTSGLEAGELVVTAGVHKLREDQVVRHAASL